MTNGNMYHTEEGMPLRDYFAAHALNLQTLFLESPQEIAVRCYQIADAMIAERDK